MLARFRPPVLLSVLVSVIAVSLTGSLQAAPMTSDVQAIISLGPPVNAWPATAAAGPFPGNDKPTDLLNRLNNLNLFGTGITTWTLIGSSDEVSNGPFDSNPSTTSGQILLDNPINGPFVIAVKGGNSYAAYYFDNSFSNVLGFLFTTAGLDPVGSGNPPNLSHMSLYMPQGGGPGNGGGGGGSGTGDPMPEPATLAVLGLLLVILAVLHRRRVRQAA